MVTLWEKESVPGKSERAIRGDVQAGGQSQQLGCENRGAWREAAPGQEEGEPGWWPQDREGRRGWEAGRLEGGRHHH